MDPSFDRFLLIKIQDQDPDVFEELSFRYRDRLLRAAMGMCRNEVDAEDLVQETMVRAYQGAPKFEGKSALYTWLYGIMRFVQMDRWRKKKKDHVLTDFSEMDVIDPMSEEGNTKIEVIQHEVSQLDDASNEVIRLYYFDKLSVDEMSEKLGLAKGTVKSRLFHARKKLKAKKSLMDLMGIDPEQLDED